MVNVVVVIVVVGVGVFVGKLFDGKKCEMLWGVDDVDDVDFKMDVKFNVDYVVVVKKY